MREAHLPVQPRCGHGATHVPGESQLTAQGQLAHGREVGEGEGKQGNRQVKINVLERPLGPALQCAVAAQLR